LPPLSELRHDGGVKRRWIVIAAVFGLFAIRLGYRVESSGIASDWVDPVGRIAAQDEAVYSHIALRMARTGEWLTPRFLDRLALFKPPMLYWLSGISAKLFGPSNLSLRLPSILAGAAVAALAVAWALSWGPWQALAVALLLAANPLLHRLARLNLMDALLAALFLGGACIIRADPALKQRASRIGFGALVGAGILTKAIAGSLPLVMLALYWVLALREERPRLRALLEVAAWAALAAAPWHLYQWIVHPQWFWSEYIIDEHFRSAIAPLGQTSREGQLDFYVRRWGRIDPVLLGAWLLGLPWLAWALWKRRSAEILVPLCALAAVCAAVLAFQYRNAAYLLPAMAPAALCAVAAGPLRHPWGAAFASALLVAALVWRVVHPTEVWGLPFPEQASAPSAQDLDRYAAQNRGRDLIIVFPTDEFYSTLLPAQRVRYVFTDDGRHRARPAMDFRYLGITLSVEEFLDIDRRRPVFEERLRRFNLDTAAPLGTVIELSSEAEFPRLIAGAPRADFFLPGHLCNSAPAGRAVVPASGGRCFVYGN
jgi:hypothetical protein